MRGWRVVPVLLVLASVPLARGATPTVGPTLPTRYLDVAGGRLAYDDTGGSGPLVVAVSGMGDLRQEYRFLRPFLTGAGYRVVTLDLRGFGETSAAWPDYSPRAVGGDLLAVEAALGRRSAILVGNSYAGGAALWAAHDAPDRVTALVLLDPVLRDPPAPVPWYGRAMLALAFASPWRVSLWLRYWDGLFPTRTPPDQAAYRRALGRNLEQPGRMTALDAMLHTSKATVLGQVRVPALAIMGSRDVDYDDPATEAAWIFRQSGIRTTMIEGAGHYPHAEMPERVGAEVTGFLGRVGGGPR